MKLKKGDKLYCKKDFSSTRTGNGSTKIKLFSAGNSYYIREVGENDVSVYFTVIHSGWTTFIIDESKTSIWDKDFENLYDYFYTTKQVRKLKLNEIKKR